LTDVELHILTINNL